MLELGGIEWSVMVRRSKVEVGQVKSSCNEKGKEEKVF